MKRVIDGKIYDTETAEELHAWSNHLSGSDFNHCEESLYLTKKGAFFLAGSGGPMSKYSESNGNSTLGSSGISVLTEAEAVAWLEDHDGSEVLIDHPAFKSVVVEG